MTTYIPVIHAPAEDCDHTGGACGVVISAACITTCFTCHRKGCAECGEGQGKEFICYLCTIVEACGCLCQHCHGTHDGCEGNGDCVHNYYDGDPDEVHVTAKLFFQTRRSLSNIPKDVAHIIASYIFHPMEQPTMGDLGKAHDLAKLAVPQGFCSCGRCCDTKLRMRDPLWHDDCYELCRPCNIAESMRIEMYEE